MSDKEYFLDLAEEWELKGNSMKAEIFMEFALAVEEQENSFVCSVKEFSVPPQNKNRGGLS